MSKHKYFPKTRDELKALCDDESVNLGEIDVSQITDMSVLFWNSQRSDFSGIESWDVSNVTDMNHMFAEASSFNQPLDAWDIRRVCTATRMFFGASAFCQRLESWQPVELIHFEEMFKKTKMKCFPKWYGTKNVRKIIEKKDGKYLPKTRYELKVLCDDKSMNLGEIDVSKITDTSNLFYDSKRSDFSGIESWDVSNVTDMNHMFAEASSFNQPLDSWDVSSVTNMECMFWNAANFNQPLNSWDVSNVENMHLMFCGAESFNQPLDSWDVSKVRYMKSMFCGASSFNQPLDSWDVGSVESMKGMFRSSGVKNLPKWHKSKE